MAWTRQGPSPSTWVRGALGMLLTVEGEPILAVEGDGSVILLADANVDSWARQSPGGASWSLAA